jgi:hypothetical protein
MNDEEDFDAVAEAMRLMGGLGDCPAADGDGEAASDAAKEVIRGWCAGKLLAAAAALEGRRPFLAEGLRMQAAHLRQRTWNYASYTRRPVGFRLHSTNIDSVAKALAEAVTGRPDGAITATQKALVVAFCRAQIDGADSDRRVTRAKTVLFSHGVPDAAPERAALAYAALWERLRLFARSLSEDDRKWLETVPATGPSTPPPN